MSSLKQAVYLILCSILLGIVFNNLRPNGISIIAKTDTVYEQFDKYLIESVDLENAKKLFDDGILFIDARLSEPYSNGHIQGAIPSNNYDNLLDELFFNHSLDDPVVIYCDNSDCGLSEDLAVQLEMDGFSNLYVFKGGWGEWLKAGYPVVK
jgi:rhodanese-related sulfurtransferase